MLLIVTPSPHHILIPFESKYLPQDRVFKYRMYISDFKKKKFEPATGTPISSLAFQHLSYLVSMDGTDLNLSLESNAVKGFWSVKLSAIN